MRWVGLTLVVLAISSWVYAAYFLGVRCGDDCGDQGGRGVLLGAMTVSVFALLEAAVIMRSLVRDGRRNA